MNAFHLAIPVRDIEEAKKFYTSLPMVKIGREGEMWTDFDFFGHQLSIHLKAEATCAPKTNMVDGKSVPVRHFGIILEWDDWQNMSARFRADQVEFTIEPYIRFEGQVGEQATLFLSDPSGNAIEFKSFKDMHYLFQADAKISTSGF